MDIDTRLEAYRSEVWGLCIQHLGKIMRVGGGVIPLRFLSALPTPLYTPHDFKFDYYNPSCCLYYTPLMLTPKYTPSIIGCPPSINLCTPLH